MNLEGRLIGNRYEILERIGNGGMATVYKSRDHVLNRNVAVKVLKEEFTTDAEFVKRFNIEAQSAASLTHPNIVSIYDVGSEDDIHYIVMELVQGKTLKEIIMDEGVLPWKWTVNIAIQIASALEVAHRNNIVHRDIKPHNIIITEDGTAKVTDFGIAKAVSNSTITSFGSTIGSVHYFSPEQARGGYTDAKSDLYSLGVVMYEMLTGKVPFDADTPVSIALKHMQEKAIEPKVINPTIPDSINKIIIKAMEKEPNLRYISATEMLNDLKEVIKNPNGNFVVMNAVVQEDKTRVISTEEANKEVQKQEVQKEEKRNEEKPKKKKSLKRKIITVLIVLLICAIIFGGAMFATWKLLVGNRAKQVQIPNLVEMNIEDAKTKLNELKLKYSVSEEFSPDGKEAGLVLAQDPKYQDNYKINEETILKLTVSKGLEMVTVPKVAGLTKDEAILKLDVANLEVEITEENNDKIQEGIVISQDIEADTEVAKNSTVKIVVSLGRGIKEVTVPYLIGKTEEDAKKAIETAELTVGTIKYESDTTKSNGVVLKQGIEADKKVDEKTAVSLTVNKLAEIKKGTVNINLKSLLGYKKQVDEEGKDIPAKSVEVMVKVTSDGSEDTIYKKSHKEDTEKITVPVEGIGTITVKVFIDDVRKTQEQMDLNKDNPVLNID
ncbi:MAG: Stk1 family PASTA domain-containing Ser/Thr kinase [Clostridia bacterium]|nr:Stk1 family PASTA domain-containing Ser/Thr kinase [Clostridia bacterium]